MIELDGQPWFVAADVASILGFTTTAGAGWYLRHLDDDEVNTITLTDGNRGNPNKRIISESGLYKLITRSDKHKPVHFMKLTSTWDLIREVEETVGNPTFSTVNTTSGRNGGTYVVKELVYAYAMS